MARLAIGPAQPDVLPLAHAQERLLLAEQLAAGGADSQLVHAHLLHGRLDRDALAAAVADVARRHPALRTIYAWAPDGSPVQHVLAPPDTPEILEPAIAPTTQTAAQSDWQPAEVAAGACADWWDRPFDLEAAPPFRARTVSLTPDRHLVCLSWHQIACDGWSSRIVADDLSDAYATRLTGRTPYWPAIPAFGDYVRWERANLGRWLVEDLPFWRRNLDDLDPLLPGDQPREGESRRVEHAVSLDTARLRTFTALTRRQRLTALLYATAEAFGAKRRSARMCLGTLVSGRQEPRFRPVVGSFVNMMAVPVVRRPGQGRAAGRDALTRMVLDCLHHSRTPFDEVVRVVPPADRSGAWFKVLVSLNDWSGDWRPDTGMDRRPIVLTAPRTAWGLLLEATRERDEPWVLRGRWRADGDSCRHIVDAVAHAILDG